MGKPINVEVDPKCDFDLHFDIWELDKNKFIELFNSFPKGADIGNNAYDLKNGLIEEFNQKLSNNEIISETQKAINDIQKIAYSEELNNSKIIFRTGNSMSDLTDINYSEMISIEIDDQLYDFVKKGTSEIGYNAYHFLREPMYRMHSSYVPCRWVLWTLTDIKHINPYKSLLKLENNNCSVFLIDDGGVLIFKTEK